MLIRFIVLLILSILIINCQGDKKDSDVSTDDSIKTLIDSKNKTDIVKQEKDKEKIIEESIDDEIDVAYYDNDFNEKSGISLNHNVNIIEDIDNKDILIDYYHSQRDLTEPLFSAESERILREIFYRIEQGEILPQWNFEVEASMLFCELLLNELEMTNELTVLDEIEPIITRLLKLAEDRQSYLTLTETKLLQAKLALIRMDLDKARSFLTQAQEIARNMDFID